MNFDEPAFAQRPALLGTQLESPEHEQFDCTWEDVEEEEGSTTSALMPRSMLAQARRRKPLGT